MSKVRIKMTNKKYVTISDKLIYISAALKKHYKLDRYNYVIITANNNGMNIKFFRSIPNNVRSQRSENIFVYRLSTRSGCYVYNRVLRKFVDRKEYSLTAPLFPIMKTLEINKINWRRILWRRLIFQHFMRKRLS